MAIVAHSDAREFSLPGIRHRTVAGSGQGLQALEVWVQELDPGAETPVHRHACEEAIVVLSGEGEVVVEGERIRFGEDSTIVVPAYAVHQLVNTGSRVIRTVAAFAACPARVETATGGPFPVPWDGQ